MSHISNDEEGTRKSILSHLGNLQKKFIKKINCKTQESGEGGGGGVE
jgi:hypothetical protein